MGGQKDNKKVKAPPPLHPGVYNLLHYGDNVEGFLDMAAELPRTIKEYCGRLREMDAEWDEQALAVRHELGDILEGIKAKFNSAAAASDLEGVFDQQRLAQMVSKRAKIEEGIGNKIQESTAAYNAVDDVIRRLDEHIVKLEAGVKEVYGTPPLPLPLTYSAAATAALARKGSSGGIVPATVDPSEPVYCYCRNVSFGEMVGCDNEECPYEWFHFHCVRLTEQPSGDWTCPTCRGEEIPEPLPLLKKDGVVPGAEGVSSRPSSKLVKERHGGMRDSARRSSAGSSAGQGAKPLGRDGFPLLPIAVPKVAPPQQRPMFPPRPAAPVSVAATSTARSTGMSSRPKAAAAAAAAAAVAAVERPNTSWEAGVASSANALSIPSRAILSSASQMDVDAASALADFADSAPKPAPPQPARMAEI